MRTWRMRGGAGVVAVAFALTGCGDVGISSGPEATTTTSEPLAGPAEIFRAEANGVCAAARQRRDRRAAGVLDAPDRTDVELEFSYRFIVSDHDREYDELALVEAPEDVAAVFDAYLELFYDAAVDLAFKGPDGLLTPDDPFNEASKVAKAIGLDACAR